MTHRPVLRLFAFRPRVAGAELDAHLREDLVPAMLELAGLREVWVGRRGIDDVTERLVVSIWESRDALIGAGAGPDARGALGVERDRAVEQPNLDVLDIAVDLRFDRPEPARVVRVYHGQVREGELDGYVEDARSGTLEDVAASRGPVRLYLAPRPPDAFVTVSVWADWAVVEAATGGNIANPVATRHRERLVRGSATHYEVLPNALERNVREATRIV